MFIPCPLGFNIGNLYKMYKNSKKNKTENLSSNALTPKTYKVLKRITKKDGTVIEEIYTFDTEEEAQNFIKTKD